jgi:hypothetical protein
LAVQVIGDLTKKDSEKKKAESKIVDRVNKWLRD